MGKMICLDKHETVVDKDGLEHLQEANKELLKACEFAYNELSGKPRPNMIILLQEKLKKAINKEERK